MGQFLSDKGASVHGARNVIVLQLAKLYFLPI